MKNIIFFLSGSILAITFATAAQLYRWVDDKGNVIIKKGDVVAIYMPMVPEAATIAEANDAPYPDFFMAAGDKFRSQDDGWLPAARLYFEAIRFYSSTETPRHVFETYREALYKSANRREMPMVMPMEEIMHLDPPMALVAQARHTFFTGKKKEAFDLLQKAWSIEDTSREAALLEGEFAALEHKPDQAKPILTRLVEDTGSTPEWIRLFAKQILDGMK